MVRETVPTGFSPNADSRQLMIGAAYVQPQAWVYLPLVNPNNWSRKMVLNLDHNRCDTLDAFLLRGHQREIIYLGKLFRSIPLARRAVPVRMFALPFELIPQDSVGLLLQSRRTTGIHEFSIRISAKPYFTIKQDEEQINRLLVMSSAFFFTFTVFSLGLIFNNRLLVYLGVYACTIALGLLDDNYFFDGFPFPPWLGLNANSISLFIIFLTNWLSHPFGVAYLKSLNLYGRWHQHAVRLLVAANLIQLVLLLFPLTLLTNIVVTKASLILMTLTIGWLFFISILGFIKKREKYLLMTTALVFLPIPYRMYLLDTLALSYSYFELFYYLLIFGLLTVTLLKRELISRQMSDRTIWLMQASLQQLRKSEIEQIGQNLHDQLGNTLASALGYLTTKKPKVMLARKMILNAINESRVISHNLVKDDERPLAEKLDELAEQFNAFSSICCVYSDFSDKIINQLTPLKQQGVYLIVQEVLNHVIKHSQAREVVIQTFLSEGNVRVSIEDDGYGFQPTEQTNSIGVTNMNKRAELTKLTLLIDSGPGGTLVSIETPLAG